MKGLLSNSANSLNIALLFGGGYNLTALVLEQIDFASHDVLPSYIKAAGVHGIVF